MFVLIQSSNNNSRRHYLLIAGETGLSTNMTAGKSLTETGGFCLLTSESWKGLCIKYEIEQAIYFLNLPCHTLVWRHSTTPSSQQYHPRFSCQIIWSECMDIMWPSWVTTDTDRMTLDGRSSCSGDCRNSTSWAKKTLNRLSSAATSEVIFRKSGDPDRDWSTHLSQILLQVKQPFSLEASAALCSAEPHTTFRLSFSQ